MHVIRGLSTQPYSCCTAFYLLLFILLFFFCHKTNHAAQFLGPSLNLRPLLLQLELLSDEKHPSLLKLNPTVPFSIPILKVGGLWNLV